MVRVVGCLQVEEWKEAILVIEHLLELSQSFTRRNKLIPNY